MASVQSNVNKEALQQIEPKSYERYVSAYEKLMQWRKSQNTNLLDEEVLLGYFVEIAKTMKPSTLWSIYSMLKATISSNHNICIGQYNKLRSFLKNISSEFEFQLERIVFTVEEIKKFLTEAPDSKYLGIKTVAVFGVCGVPTYQLTLVTVDQIIDHGTEILVKIPCPKTKATRVYLISGSFGDIIRKYIKLRPPQMTTNRFFVQYRAQKCTRQVMGKHSFAKFPTKIAEFLGLPDTLSYNGRSFPKISTILDAKGSILKFNLFPTFSDEHKSIGKSQIQLDNDDVNVNARGDTNPFPNLRIKQENDCEIDTGQYIFNIPRDHTINNCDTHDSSSEGSQENDSSSEGSQEKTASTCTAMEYQHQNEVCFVDSWSLTNPKKEDVDVSIDMSSIAPHQSISFFQSKIEAQEKEIVRLKQLTERQSSKIQSLEAVLKEYLTKPTIGDNFDV